MFFATFWPQSTTIGMPPPGFTVPPTKNRFGYFVLCFGALKARFLKRSLTKHPCGAFLLPRPIHLDDKFKISPDNLRRVVALLKATFTHLVVDVSKSYGPLDMTIMEVSDTILLTTQRLICAPLIGPGRYRDQFQREA